MSDLKAWLDDQKLSEELVTVRGRQFLVVELNLAERGRLFADGSGELANDKAEGLLLSRCVLDPETREQLVETKDWKYWSDKGASFAPLLRAVLRINGLADDTVGDEVKN